MGWWGCFGGGGGGGDGGCGGGGGGMIIIQERRCTTVVPGIDKRFQVFVWTAKRASCMTYPLQYRPEVVNM